MGKQYYSDDQISDIRFQINMVCTDADRLDPETIATKHDAQTAFNNLLMGVYNLRDEMGLE